MGSHWNKWKSSSIFWSGSRMTNAHGNEIDNCISKISAVLLLRELWLTVVARSEASREAKLSVFKSVYLCTFIYGHELWVTTERTNSQIQAAGMKFLRRVTGATRRDRMRNSATRESLHVEQLLLIIERSQSGWVGHVCRMPPERLPRGVLQAKITGERSVGRLCTRE